MTAQCLGCYEPLAAEGYHPACSRNLFGTSLPPLVDWGSDELEELALKSISRHLGITGVQPKLSADLAKHADDPAHRLKITGLWGSFILKPPSARFEDMPTIEDATMHMAAAAGIPTARHGLIRLQTGELSYVTRRFDREKKRGKTRRIAVEDFCQLSGLLTERKYKTSMEKAGKIILEHSASPGLDLVTFFDITIFSFLTGNADMHLKNFSLMEKDGGEIGLAPAYDLLSTKLMPINDPDEMALTVNGKKARLKRKDFEALGATLGLVPKVMENCFARLTRAMPEMKRIAQVNFAPVRLKREYLKLLDARMRLLK